MSAPVLALSGVRVGPPHAPILEGIDLTLDAGHFLGIVGPNGAGKSTLLAVTAGLIPPDSGHVDLFGECLRRFNRRRLLHRVGYLAQLQEPHANVPVRVREIVAMGLPDYAAPLWRRRGGGAEVTEALRAMEIEALADADYRALSGGQRQRVRLARALVGRPGLLLLDEPSAALDAQGQARLYRLLRRYCDERGAAVVMVDHDVAAVTSHVDSVACLNRRLHYHGRRGERIPESVWRAMYGEGMQPVAHDADCIGCGRDGRG